uniref:Uncharacterized protein n=1 Tax=Homalodisca liturata TaxID=320908 RepID=A0A1B6J149_9HEMI
MKSKVKVCKKMFLQTLGVGEWAVSNWVRKSFEQGLVNEDEVTDEERDQINTRKNETDKAKKALVESFFEALPFLNPTIAGKTVPSYTWSLSGNLKQRYTGYTTAFAYHKIKKTSICLVHETFDECNLSLF